MSNLGTAMALLLETFKKYARAEGQPDTLTKAEVKTLLENEFPGLAQEGKNQDVDKLMQDLDVNGDAQIDFSEFMVLVTGFTCAINEILSQ